MKSLTEIQKIIKDNQTLIREKYKVSRIGVFGSFVKNKANQESDLDLLVDYEENPDLLELIDLENYLSEQLKLKVDIVTVEGLKQHFKEQILSEVVYL